MLEMRLPPGSGFLIAAISHGFSAYLRSVPLPWLPSSCQKSKEVQLKKNPGGWGGRGKGRTGDPPPSVHYSSSEDRNFASKDSRLDKKGLFTDRARECPPRLTNLFLAADDLISWLAVATISLPSLATAEKIALALRKGGQACLFGEGDTPSFP